MQELEPLPARIADKVAGGLGIKRWIDLALHLPARYQDEATLSTLLDLVDNAQASLVGTLVANEIVERPRRQLIARLDVDGGSITLRWFHFYPNQQAKLTPGQLVKVTGVARKSYKGWEIIHPKLVFNPRPEEWVGTVSLAGESPPESAGENARLTPVYPTVSGVKQSDFARWLKQAPQACFDDVLPAAWIEQLQLPAWADTLRTLHGDASPDTVEALNARTHPAWQRIKFEELLAQQLALRQAREQREQVGAPALLAIGPPVHSDAFLSALPFRLTGAQQRVLTELQQDLRLDTAMQRLLQGDVGSGKTVVAALACACTADAGWQSAFMAPTEILAEQHHTKLTPLFTAAGMRSALLTGSTGKKEKQRILGALLAGEIHVLIGTHALIEDDVRFLKLGLVVIDEQHRFGVSQRLALLHASEAGLMPHQLMMSATPIPRTLAQTYLSDLDVSVLDDKPPGRQPITTKLVSHKRREELYQSLQVELSAGRQVYWVCPLIEESESLALQAAEQTFAELTAAMPAQRIALVHGRLPASEKAAVMGRFARNEVQLLVSTTVIEVGVDVPNASIMVIEHAERFGLAQLHQLRGRVGRGDQASICILLFGDPLSWTGKQRLVAMRDSQDGFWLAEKDLELRGPGELLGKRQSGVPMLKHTDPVQEKEWVRLSRHYASQVGDADSPWVNRLTERWFGKTEWWLS